jgi:hypothetical protein
MTSFAPGAPLREEIAVMREFIKSLVSFSWAVSLFGVRQLQNVLAPRDPDLPACRAAAAFEAVAQATEEQLSGPIKEIYRTGENLQRDMVNMMFRAFTPRARQAANREEGSGVAVPATPVVQIQDAQKESYARQGRLPSAMSMGTAPAAISGYSGKLDTRTLLVLGEGLAAGMGDFSLSEETQRTSFPNLLAQQMGATFAQPLIEAPGIGEAIGFPGSPVCVPAVMQTTVLSQFPFPAPFSNLSIPGFKVEDALIRRPIPPLVYRDNAKQTAVNLILGLPDLLLGRETRLPTQLECALQQSPSCVLIELGYYDVLEPAVKGDLDRLPEIATLCSQFARLLAPLREGKAEVLLLTVPDPTDTAYFSSLEAAARFLRVQPALLDRTYGLPKDCLITVNGLIEIADQILNGQFKPLGPGEVLSAAVSQRITCQVRALNAELLALAEVHGALVFDLHGLFRRVRQHGITVGSQRLTADYFGGFYSLNGYYPGPIGQASIARELLELVNHTYGAAFYPMDINSVLVQDPVGRYQAAQGPELAREENARPVALPLQAFGSSSVAISGGESARGRGMSVPKEMVARSASGSSKALRLPASLEQVLPLNKALSYHGDGIRIVHCQDDKESRYGSCARLLFGGLAMFGSHLRGSLRIKFSPPVSQVTHFEVNWGDGLVGDDGVLSAPQFFRLPVLQPRVFHWPGTVGSGDLNLETGEVSNLDFKVRYVNSALEILVKGNPNFPKQPIQFPGAYGSAWARFEQRPDEKLDFIFQGTTFIPLGKDLQGDPVRWPLPFGAFTDHPASVPAAGTAMHPHLHLSTKETGEVNSENTCLDIPFNTIQEFTLFTHNSSFGDKFSLKGKEFGGDAQGRSQLMGRVQIQFGERFGDSVPVAVSTLPPGGMLAKAPDLPLAELFPGRLPIGSIGHDEFLRFPLRTYFLDAVSFIDDPFDLAVGAINLKTGELLGELLHRGFIGQNLFFALVRVEPRTPRTSFFFQGPASFEKGANGQLVYRFNGTVHIPYPEGYRFPAPDLTTHYLAGPNSALDPFLRLQAMHGGAPTRAGKKGGADEVVASNGNRFSYRYAIPLDPARERAVFEYTNHTQGGTFRMHGLAWHSFTHSRTRSMKLGESDTVTFTGYGTWSKDPNDNLHVATVQVSTSREYPYVSIQIDGGLVSNVNTKPEVDETTFA